MQIVSVSKKVLLLFCALLLLSCSLLLPSFSPLKTQYKEELTPEQVGRELSNRTIDIDTLWARMKLVLKGRGIKGKKLFNATLLYEPPEKIRVRADRLYRMIFQILVRGDLISVYFDRQKLLYVGTIHDLKDSSEKLLLSRPAEIVNALLVEQKLLYNISEDKVSEYYSDADYYYFRCVEGERTTLFKVRKKDLLVENVRIFDTRGFQTAEVKYKRYMLFNNDVLPSDLELVSTEAEQNLRTKISEYRMNQDFRDEVFSFSMLKPKRILPLQELFRKDE